MAEFGEKLRRFRHQCNDPGSPHGKLTQERFGQLVGEELGISYSGAAVSDWERGASKIHADQRAVLISLFKVLHQYGGIETSLEANQLLEAGNYRALDLEEAKSIFPESPNDLGTEQSIPKPKISRSFVPFLMENIFSIPEEELRMIITKAEEGPSPYWPRVLAAFMRKASDRWSISITGIFWIAVWFMAWWADRSLLALAVCGSGYSFLGDWNVYGWDLDYSPAHWIAHQY